MPAPPPPEPGHESGIGRAGPLSRRERFRVAVLQVTWRLLVLGCFVIRPRLTSVHVAVWSEGRLLVIENTYRRGIGLPGGFRGRGEPAARAASRELEEEVGLRIAPDRLRFLAEIEILQEWRRDKVSFFEATVDGEPPLRIDRREIRAAGFVQVAGIAAKPISPALRLYLERFHGRADAAGPAGG